jgi:polyisoprenoid-binding protein YceI
VHATASRLCIKHRAITTLRGAFTEFKGTVEIGEDLSTAKAYGSVKVNSIDTNDPQRDSHLRSPDFLDAPHYPQLRVNSMRMMSLDGRSFQITGRLIIRGVTELDLALEISAVKARDPTCGQLRPHRWTRRSLPADHNADVDHAREHPPALAVGDVLL